MKLYKYSVLTAHTESWSPPVCGVHKTTLLLSFLHISILIYSTNWWVWSLLILLDPSWLRVGLLPSWWSNLRANLHHKAYATKIQCGIFFALRRQLFGCVVILKMTSARGLFLGRATSPSSLSCCPPPHLPHTGTHTCRCLNALCTKTLHKIKRDTYIKESYIRCAFYITGIVIF